MPSGGTGAGIVLGIKARYEVGPSVRDLLRHQAPVKGRYVLVAAQAGNPLLDLVAARRAAGAVDAIDGDQLLLRDAPILQRVPAAEAWLGGRPDVVLDVLHVLAGPAATRLMERHDEAVFELTGAEGRLREDR